MDNCQKSDPLDRMRERLDELRRDYQKGQGQLQQLMRQEAETRDGLLRVSGAIRILEEMLPDPPDTDGAAAQPEGADGTAGRAATNARPGPRVMSVP
ncbi:hypothetical protein MTF65_03910 [Streptomyces sp. APSN-46.1]|uniref:hypothetical protein n=1 Tax=Streptomyces sp. APSN-46.1 TaxID=2929049 RepID=UPI001FB55310|nr:hypothetical protein [Streptomyces sp. APSN-46.1]MCJ1676509.1 hypothetical protein [Streptomyces sp. APSN-46.1]